MIESLLLKPYLKMSSTFPGSIKKEHISIGIHHLFRQLRISLEFFEEFLHFLLGAGQDQGLDRNNLSRGILKTPFIILFGLATLKNRL